MNTAMEIGREVAERAVSARPAPGEGASANWCVRLWAPDGTAVYGWHFASEGGAKDHTGRVVAVVAALIADAIERDREQRCSGCEAEKKALVAALRKARGFIETDRSLIVNSETVDGDESTMDASARAEVYDLDEMLGEIERLIGSEAHSQASGGALGHGTRNEEPSPCPLPGGEGARHTAEPLRPRSVSTVAPGSMPSSADSAGSAVKDSCGGEAC